MTMVRQGASGLYAAAILVLLLWAGLVPRGHAQDTADPARVVDQYLASLVTGNTQVLSTLIEGHVKRRNRQLTMDPASYGAFLTQHYKGVKTTVEDISPRGKHVVARVRFDFPGGDASVIKLVLTQAGGRWKITDEDY